MNLKEFADDVHSARHQFGEPGRNFGSSSVCRGRCRSNRRGWLRAPVRPLLVSRRRSRTRHRARSGFLCHTACGKAAQNIRLYQAGRQASRTSGAPNFLPQPDCCPGNRLPHSPALPVAVAIPDFAIPFSGLSVIFHKRQGNEDDPFSRNPDRRTAG